MNPRKLNKIALKHGLDSVDAISDRLGTERIKNKWILKGLIKPICYDICNEFKEQDLDSEKTLDKLKNRVEEEVEYLLFN